MSGNSEASKLAARRLLKANPNHFKEVGRLGGQKKAGRLKGKPELARELGKLGGRPKGLKMPLEQRQRQSETMKAKHRGRREMGLL